VDLANGSQVQSGTGPSADGIYAALLRRGVTRREFLRFSAAMAAALALPVSYGPRIAAAVEAAPRLPVIWLHGQACGGDSLSFLRASQPSTASLVLDLLSLEYDELLMGPAGSAAAKARADAMRQHPNGYLAIVEGAIPTASDGIYGTIGGRPLRDVVREVCAGALGTIAVGSCAFDGGAPAASGGRTGAVGVSQVVTSPRYVALPGCPVNVEDLTATIVHYLTFQRFPEADWRGRPLSFYGNVIHNQCERRAHFEFGEFVLSWGDEGAQKGWCLYKMGCKGPETFGDCPTIQYAEKTSWPVRAGHGCIGCRMPGFWDTAGSAYRRLPGPLPPFPDITVDQVGAAMVAGVAALTVVHGGASIVRSKVQSRAEREHVGGGSMGLPIGSSQGVPSAPGVPTPSAGATVPDAGSSAPPTAAPAAARDARPGADAAQAGADGAPGRTDAGDEPDGGAA
jgi:hydrogenase small subunit